MFDDVRRSDVRARLLARNGAARISSLSLTRSERRTVARMLSEKALTSHPDHVVSLPSAKTFVVTCRRLGGVVSCGHAMKHYGIPLRTSPGVLHVAIPAQRSRVADAIGRTVVHRVRGLALPEDTQPPVAQVEQALICFMRCADELDALIALDAALRLGYTTRAQLESALPGPRNASLRSLLSQACPGARSLLETIARHDLEQAGYRPVAAVMVDGVGEVDLVLSQRPQAIVPGPAEGTHVLTAAAYPALLIETDGYTYHSSRPDWHSEPPARSGCSRARPYSAAPHQQPGSGSGDGANRLFGGAPSRNPPGCHSWRLLGQLGEGAPGPCSLSALVRPSSPLAGCQWLREKSPIVTLRCLLPRVGELPVECEHVEESTHARPRHPPQGAPAPALHGVDAPGDPH